MTEEEARGWIAHKFGAEAADKVSAFLDHVVAENLRQNLVAPSTIETIWLRHALDSVQLAALAPSSEAPWLDIGSGGGFPGMVAAIVRPEPFFLIEPRRRRAQFLVDCVERLGLSNRVSVEVSRVEKVTILAGTLSARAVASVQNLLEIAEQCSSCETVWMLPRGKFCEADVVSLRQSWHFVFHVEQSITDPGSSILILREVRRR